MRLVGLPLYPHTEYVLIILNLAENIRTEYELFHILEILSFHHPALCIARSKTPNSSIGCLPLEQCLYPETPFFFLFFPPASQFPQYGNNTLIAHLAVEKNNKNTHQVGNNEHRPRHPSAAPPVAPTHTPPPSYVCTPPHHTPRSGPPLLPPPTFRTR